MDEFYGQLLTIGMVMGNAGNLAVYADSDNAIKSFSVLPLDVGKIHQQLLIGGSFELKPFPGLPYDIYHLTQGGRQYAQSIIDGIRRSGHTELSKALYNLIKNASPGVYPLSGLLPAGLNTTPSELMAILMELRNLWVHQLIRPVIGGFVAQ